MALKVRRNSTFVPLAPGAMKKSILDAHLDLQCLLDEAGIHSYFKQAAGEDNKVVLPAVFMQRGEQIETKLSLYIPETKDGSMPRFWVYGLNRRMSAGEVLGIHVFDGKVWLFNASDRDMVLRSYEAAA